MAGLPLIRPCISLADIFGTGVFHPRQPRRGYGWLPHDPPFSDGLTGYVLPVVGDLPTLCHRSTVTPAAREILAAGGVEPGSNPLIYDTREDLAELLSVAASEGHRIISDCIHPPQLFAPESYWVDRALLCWLNNKGHLDQLVPPEGAPSRRVVSRSELTTSSALTPELPVVVKAATDLSSNGGYDVMICRSAADVRQAADYFAGEERIVVEQWLPMERNLCVNFATVAGRTEYLGTAEQVSLPSGGYSGNWIEPHAKVPWRAIDLGREIMQRAVELGYRGVAGFDMAIEADGRVRVFDLNFRLNGCTPSLLLQQAVAAKYPHQVGRLRRWLLPRPPGRMVAELRRLIQDRHLLPLAVCDATVSPYDGARSAVYGLLLGRTRDEVTAKQRLLDQVGLQAGRCARDAAPLRPSRPQTFARD